MTEVKACDLDSGEIVCMSSAYKINPNEVAKKGLTKIWAEKEASIIKDLEDRGLTIISVKSEFISKRRYKRRYAKEMLKLAK